MPQKVELPKQQVAQGLVVVEARVSSKPGFMTAAAKQTDNGVNMGPPAPSDGWGSAKKQGAIYFVFGIPLTATVSYYCYYNL